MKKILVCLIVGVFFFVGTVSADTFVVPVYRLVASGEGKLLGSVTFKDTKNGLLIEPNLHGLPPGAHGFHVHEKPSCADGGMAAGGHFDPQQTEQHRGPFRSGGHLGDLPVLLVGSNGFAKTPSFAPRLKVIDIKNHALIIHEGGDNYSDVPQKLGGGGSRVACGILGAAGSR